MFLSTLLLTNFYRAFMGVGTEEEERVSPVPTVSSRGRLTRSGEPNVFESEPEPSSDSLVAVTVPVLLGPVVERGVGSQERASPGPGASERSPSLLSRSLQGSCEPELTGVMHDPSTERKEGRGRRTRPRPSGSGSGRTKYRNRSRTLRDAERVSRVPLPGRVVVTPSVVGSAPNRLMFRPDLRPRVIWVGWGRNGDGAGSDVLGSSPFGTGP